MSALKQEKVIIALKNLGKLLLQPTDGLEKAIFAAQHHNPWFTPKNVKQAIQAFGLMLQADDINHWFNTIHFTSSPKKIGLILAGNIPMVGLHDVFCVLATGNKAVIKLSTSDTLLIKAVLLELINIEPLLAEHIEYVERLKDFDAVIATGSNNSSRYFEYYFGKVPNIIRKNRNSVAILDGTEHQHDLNHLGNDIFDYFGLGCRSVSKIYLPKNYNIATFYGGIEAHNDLINHFKYQNNYDYNKSVYLVNAVDHFDNGFLLLKEDENLASPLAVLFFEYYENTNDLTEKLALKKPEIQCIVTNCTINLPTFPFGQSQKPKLWDYADDVNTIEFLNQLS